LTEIFVVEDRSTEQIPVANKMVLCRLVCQPIFFASSLDRAEFWMQSQTPGDAEKYYYCVYKTILDSDHDFELVGYYDLLGQKTTLDRCIAFVKPS